MKYLVHIIISGVLLVLFIYLLYLDKGNINDEISFTVFNDGSEETITLWYGTDYAYLFLPHYANINNMYIHLPENDKVVIGDVIYTDSMHLNNLEIDKVMDMTYYHDKRKHDYSCAV